MEQTVQKTAVSEIDINETDTPRTSNLKFLRAKRLSYFSKNASNRSSVEKEDSSTFVTHNCRNIEKPVKSRTPRRCVSAPVTKGQQGQQHIVTPIDVQKSSNNLRNGDNISEGTKPHLAGQKKNNGTSTNQNQLRSSCISDLDQDLLEDVSVPETEKLQHVMHWAKKFLNKCNVGSSLPNSFIFSTEEDEKTSNIRDEEISAFDVIKTINTTEKQASVNSIRSHDSNLLTTLQNKDTKDEESESDGSTVSYTIRDKKPFSFNSCGESMVPQQYWIPLTPKTTYKSKTTSNKILNAAEEADHLFSRWTDMEVPDQYERSGVSTVLHGFSEENKYVSERLHDNGFSPNTTSKKSNIYFKKQLSETKEEDYRSWNKSRQEEYTGQENTRFTDLEGTAIQIYEDQESRPDSASSLDTERLDALIQHFEMLQNELDKSQTMEKDVLKTDRTYLVKKLKIDTTTFGKIEKPDDKTEKDRLLYGTHVPDFRSVKANKMCPVCDCENSCNESWCTECGSVLMVSDIRAYNSTENKSPTTHDTILEDMFSSRGGQNSFESPGKSLEKVHQSLIKEQQKTCWEDSSDVISDCDGSVLDKYFFYLNHLDMIKSQEQNKEDFLSEWSSKTSSDDESFEAYRRIAERKIMQDSPSDCEDSEIQFLETTTQTKPEFTGQQLFLKDCHLPIQNVKNFNAKTYGTKALKSKIQLDRKLQTTTHMSSRGTGPKRYWEKSSIAWSSYTHGEMKPRSQNMQRPTSAESRMMIPNKHADNSAKAAKTDQRPSSATTHKVTETQSNAVTYMKATNAWAVSENLCQSKFSVFPDTIERNSGNDHGSVWLLLPDELWIYIFSLLPHKDLSQAAQVCQRFRHIANDDSLWRRIWIENCHYLNDDCLVNIGCHHPESLTLHRCYDDTHCITLDGFGKLFQNCKDSLMELKITKCSGDIFEGDTVLLHASHYCKQLSSVDLSWSAATDKGILALIQSSACLKDLSVNGCKITDHAITGVVKKYHKSLIKLEVFGCHALTAKCIISVATECVQLQTLNIGRIPKVTDVCLAKIASHLKNLVTLNLTGLNVARDRAVHFIVKQCRKLVNLTLSSCSQVTDVSLVEISTYLPTIKYLDVSGCKKVSDIGIQSLARCGQHIQYLDLSSTGVGKRGVCLLASYCHHSLECLKLSFCKDVTAEAIEKLCINCKRLKMLHLYGCRISPDLVPFKKSNKNFKIFHDLSIPTANILGE